MTQSSWETRLPPKNAVKGPGHEHIDQLFGKRTANVERMLHFGFTREEDGYVYTTAIADGQFRLRVVVTAEGVLSTEVLDAATLDPYVLHRVAHASGPLVGRVREEHEAALEAIAGICFDADAFTSPCAKAIVSHVRERRGDEPEFLWPRSPGNAIVRRQDNGKWYLELLRVRPKVLGLAGEDAVEILDIRMRTEEIERLVDGRRYHPGYHMNKRHWVTILCNGPLGLDEILARIDDSFALAAK